MKKAMLATVATFSVMFGVQAHAADLCKAGPKAEWKAQTELETKLKGEGWKIKRVKIDDGCYEVYGTDGQGKKAETYFNPKTFERVKG